MELQDTIFDKILRGEIPCSALYEDEHVLAFQDINPVSPVHVLVIPKNKIRNFSEVVQWDDAMIANFFRSVSKVTHHLKLTEAGYRVVFNTGRHGQQSVDYIHAHIIGARQCQWPPG